MFADEILLKGMPAPFTGVISHPETYRMYQKEIDKYFDYKDHDDSVIAQCQNDLQVELFSNKNITIFVGGVIIGGVIVYLIDTSTRGN